MLSRGCMPGLLLLPAFLFAQGPDATRDPTTQTTAVLSPPSFAEKWHLFVNETISPMTLVAAVPDATASQLLRFAPLYGKHFWRNDAFLKRFGAVVGDYTSQNLFSDFVLASAFHEDTRYIRKGPTRKIWPRVGYAISRAVVTRTDSGDATFNWARVIGSAMSAALSNAYYPRRSRTIAVTAVDSGTNIAGSGLSNLMPEFGPDVGHWMKRHLTSHH